MPEIKNPVTWYLIDSFRKDLLRLSESFDDLPPEYIKKVLKLYEETNHLLAKSVDPIERELSRRAAAGENLMVLP